MNDTVRAALVVAVSPFILGGIWRVCGSALSRFLTQKMTVVYDLPNIGKPRPDNKRIRGTAVICGGSLAGLWSARICADHFEDVIIVEPEAWLGTSEGRSACYDEKGVLDESKNVHSRTRVMQYESAHVFQPLKYQALKQLFPNIDEEIKKTDGRIAETEFNVHAFGGQLMRLPKVDYPAGNRPKNLFASRATYERLLRRLVMESSSRIRWVTGTATSVELADGDSSTLKSVVIRLPDNTERAIPAALVLDCTGATQAGLKWLKRLDTDKEQSYDDLRLEYNTHQRYRTYRFYVPPEAREKLPIPGGYDNATWLYTFMPNPATERKYFCIDRLEGHRLEFAFGGWNDAPLPMDYSDIKDYFRNLGAAEPVPEWFYPMMDILLEYKDLAVAFSAKFAPMSWIQYERAAHLPTNFVAIGDAVMRVNPTFGQGCTKASIGAIVLDSLLRSNAAMESTCIPRGFSAKYFKSHADKISGAWEGTKPTDYQWDSTTPVKGEKLSDENFAAGFAAIIMQLCITDPKVDSALWHIRCFLAPPTALLHPAILAKAASLWIKQRFF